MATFTEKTAAFLRQFVVKQASLLTLDSFLTKVAAALPMAKRAAFRAIQTELSSGNTLNHAIKVAFPRLSGEQRGALAVNLCKCAADSEYKKRTFESYAVPAKEGNKLMQEKCSRARLFGGNRKQPSNQIKNAKGPGEMGVPEDQPMLPPAEPAPAAPKPAQAGQNNSLGALLSALTKTPVKPMLSAVAKSPINPFFSMTNPLVGAVGNLPSMAGPAASAASVTGPAISKGFSDANASGPFSGINPYLLGALGIGGLGLGAYGASRMMRRKKRRDED
jgi:hypothetical protein